MIRKFTPLVILFCFSLFIVGNLNGQHTFSIVAVDAETGEIGSAGASCVVGAASLGGVILISDIIPGRGGINGQATVCIPHVNLENGIAQMDAGLSPQEIVDWLEANDACGAGNFTNRQYGIADFDDMGNPRTAAYTGSNALNWAGHLTGDNYAIQGNILLGSQIINDMETNFLNTEGSLAEKLMAALQGANVIGADTRCEDAGTSSTSSYLWVFKPDDDPENPFVRLNVPETQTGVEPIDSLQVLFDEWFVTSLEEESYLEFGKIATIYPNPASDFIGIEILKFSNEPYKAVLFDNTGRAIMKVDQLSEYMILELPEEIHHQVLILKLEDADGNLVQSEKILVH